jgi:hypothetical protein
MKILGILLVLELVAVSLPAQLVTFSFNGAAGNEAIFAPDAQPAGLLVGGMTRGPGITPTASAGTYSASGWNTAGRDQTDYFSFAITPYAGLSLTLTQLTLDERRSSTGIRDWCVRSSVDGFAHDLGYFHVPDDSLTRLNQTTWLGSELAHLQETVEFRIYGYSSESSAGTWRIDNVELYGSVTPVPEPSASALMAGLGLIAWVALARGWGRFSSRAVRG